MGAVKDLAATYFPRKCRAFNFVSIQSWRVVSHHPPEVWGIPIYKECLCGKQRRLKDVLSVHGPHHDAPQVCLYLCS